MQYNNCGKWGLSYDRWVKLQLQWGLTNQGKYDIIASANKTIQNECVGSW